MNEVGTNRPEYVKEDVSGEDEKFIDRDGDFAYETVDWNGPEGYVIVVAEGNLAAMKSAEALQQYYSESQGIDLKIVTDKTAEVEKEVLIGSTNRSQSGGGLAEGSLEVRIKDSKLVLNGGHDVTVNSAVWKFIRLAPEKNKAYTFQMDTDFVSAKLDGYEYVWGDEFEGAALDRTKWTFKGNMAGTSTMQIAHGEDVVAQADGRLQLRAIRCFDPTAEGVRYRVPYTVATSNNMNFTYGYVEIRARVPFQSGAWPSFWICDSYYLSDKANSGIAKKDYGIEIDIFENFGSVDTVHANIHKHYSNESRPWPNEKNSYTFNNDSGKLDQEYHTYGCEMTATEISMYVDGVKYQTFDISKSFDDNEDMSAFGNPLYLMFNNHLFVEDSSWITTLVKTGELPTEYFIDYVRLYQKPEEGRLWVDTTVTEVEE